MLEQRIAIIHQWYLVAGGGEQVVDALAQLYPQADHFALFAQPEFLPNHVKGKKLTTSFLNRLPAIQKTYRYLLPLYPLGVESLDLRGYKIIISSDGGPMKGVLVDSDAVHICYCHSPMRYVWDLYFTFLERTPALARPLFSIEAHYLRSWDFQAAQRVDRFAANSRYIAQRIRTFYRRESQVVYPPVNTQQGFLAAKQGDYYLSTGRLSHTKRLDVLIAACNRLERRFVIAGAGPEETKLKAMAGPTIEFVGFVSESQRNELYAGCRAFLFAADEDFGIAPVEAQAFGRPVVAFGKGGSLETVVGENDPLGRPPTGIYFDEQTEEAACRAILKFEAMAGQFDPQLTQQHARTFDTSVFMKNMDALVQQTIARPSNETGIAGERLFSMAGEQ